MDETTITPKRKAVKAYLEKRKILQRDASKEIGISEATFSEWINGKRDGNDSTQAKIAKWWMMQDKKSPSPPPVGHPVGPTTTDKTKAKKSPKKSTDETATMNPLDTSISTDGGYVMILSEYGISNRVKIVKTIDIAKRLNFLGAKNPDLRLEFVVRVEDPPKVMKKLSQKFASQDILKANGWFTISPCAASAALYELYKK
jgi:transcriptional regulator with XRE-family HTH domain